MLKKLLPLFLLISTQVLHGISESEFLQDAALLKSELLSLQDRKIEALISDPEITDKQKRKAIKIFKKLKKSLEKSTNLDEQEVNK